MFMVYDVCNLFLKGGYDQKMPVIVSRVAPGTPVSYQKSSCLKYLCSLKYVLKTSNYFLAAYETSRKDLVGLYNTGGKKFNPQKYFFNETRFSSWKLQICRCSVCIVSWAVILKLHLLDYFLIWEFIQFNLIYMESSILLKTTKMANTSYFSDRCSWIKPRLRLKSDIMNHSLGLIVCC